MSRLASLAGGALVIACLAVVGSATSASAQGGIVPTVTVTPSPSPATTGAVNYAVSVTDQSSQGTPTGSVTVDDGLGNSCPISLSASGDFTSSGNCSIEEPAGSLNISADYAGDTNYAEATGTTTETVNAATPTVTVTLLPITEIPHSRSPKVPRGSSGVEGLI
jgi:hypothetical protein